MTWSGTCSTGRRHFAAWEEPQLFATEIRKAFRSLLLTALDGAHHRERAVLAETIRRADAVRIASESGWL